MRDDSVTEVTLGVCDGNSTGLCVGVHACETFTDSLANSMLKPLRSKLVSEGPDHLVHICDAQVCLCEQL